ncbi:MAG: thioredoxin family protein [Rhodospirillaceae bacterium]
MKIELIHAAGCEKCRSAAGVLRQVAEEVAGDHLEWRDVNVLDELDYAVSLGVLTLPAVAVNGKIEFSSLPTADELRSVLQRHAENL